MRRLAKFPLWLIPMIYAAASVFAGIFFPRLDYWYLGSYSRAISVSSAQAFLSAVASGMMALTAIVFSIAFVIMQYSASAYSKRLILLFGRDPILFNTLGMLVATFVFALATLAYVDRSRGGQVPYFSVWIVIILLVLSVMMLGILVHRLSQLQITSVLRMVGDKGREVIDQTFSHLSKRVEIESSLKEHTEQLLRGTPLQTFNYSGQPRAITHFNVAVLVRAAQSVDAIVVMDCAVGDTLAQGARVARVFGAGSRIAEGTFLQSLQLASERTFEQDPKYTLRLLVDTAIMALSPAVNDPTTAVQSLDQIEDLVHRLGQRDLDDGYRKDGRGDLRLMLCVPTWEDYLSLAFDEIRMCGSGSLQVMRRMRSALRNLLDSLEDTDRVDAVKRYLQHLDDAVERSGLDDIDKSQALREDPQGLGTPRRAR